MLNFIVVENDTIANLILAQSKDSAEFLTGTTCIEYDAKLVNPQIGQSVVDGEVVDLEYFPIEEVEEVEDAQDESELSDVDESTPTEDGES
jgi:hypothetical protein